MEDEIGKEQGGKLLKSIGSAPTLSGVCSEVFKNL